jgi:uncharacterized membrane protein
MAMWDSFGAGTYRTPASSPVPSIQDESTAAMTDPALKDRHFPTSAGILFGLGLGGFFDGIVLHQLLQWHHMLSSWYPVNTIENLELNTRWDGIFHSSTYLFVVAGLFILWRTAQRRHLYWSTKLLAGTILIGFGAFNVVEGLIDHHLLGIHHVNELVDPSQRIYWDIGFLIWGAAMFVIGWMLWKQGQRGSPGA